MVTKTMNPASGTSSTSSSLATTTSSSTAMATKPTVMDLLKNENSHKVKSSVNEYKSLFDQDEDCSKRKANIVTLVNNFYDLVTDFYEYGWGQSFHFAPRFQGESFNESIIRAEYFLAAKLKLKPNMTCIDVGCGVGGPMRNIVRFSGAKVIGINNNDYQIKRGQTHNYNMGISTDMSEFMKSDFNNLSFADSSIDAAYAIEATCHAADKTRCFTEIARVLKPGALFAGYEWCMTDKYDPNNPEHVKAKEGIELGNSLPGIASIPDVLQALENAGFEIVEAFDPYEVKPGDFKTVPWYEPLESKWSLSGFQHTAPGRFVTHKMVQWLEFFKAAPAGSTDVSQILNDTSLHLVWAGQQEIFTPDYFFLARKK